MCEEEKKEKLDPSSVLEGKDQRLRCHIKVGRQNIRLAFGKESHDGFGALGAYFGRRILKALCVEQELFAGSHLPQLLRHFGQLCVLRDVERAQSDEFAEGRRQLLQVVGRCVETLQFREVAQRLGKLLQSVAVNVEDLER